MKNSRRNVIVFVSLVGALTVTSVLLLLLAPRPLASDLAIGVEEIDRVFDTSAEFQPGRWKYIYIHHSGSDTPTEGDAVTASGDHFVIGGPAATGGAGGGVQIGPRWQQQLTGEVTDVRLPADCVAICVVGDFDQAAPSARQVEQLEALVKAIQRRCGIAEADVLYQKLQAGSPAGIGRFFPVNALRQRVLR